MSERQTKNVRQGNLFVSNVWIANIFLPSEWKANVQQENFHTALPLIKTRSHWNVWNGLKHLNGKCSTNKRLKGNFITAKCLTKKMSSYHVCTQMYRWQTCDWQMSDWMMTGRQNVQQVNFHTALPSSWETKTRPAWKVWLPNVYLTNVWPLNVHTVPAP